MREIICMSVMDMMQAEDRTILFARPSAEQADEVEVFEMFGGDLPVFASAVSRIGKWMGDRSYNVPAGAIILNDIIHECAKERGTCGERRVHS